MGRGASPYSKRYFKIPEAPCATAKHGKTKAEARLINSRPPVHAYVKATEGIMTPSTQNRTNLSKGCVSPGGGTTATAAAAAEDEGDEQTDASFIVRVALLWLLDCLIRVLLLSWQGSEKP